VDVAPRAARAALRVPRQLRHRARALVAELQAEAVGTSLGDEEGGERPAAGGEVGAPAEQAEVQALGESGTRQGGDGEQRRGNRGETPGGEGEGRHGSR